MSFIRCDRFVFQGRLSRSCCWFLEATDGKTFTGEWSARHWVTGREYSFGSFAGQCSYDLSLKGPVPPSSSFSRSMGRDFVANIQAFSRLCPSLVNHARNKCEDAYAMDNNLLLAQYDAEERLKDVKNSIQTTAFSTQD